MAYTRASATPISWTPTSDGWKRSSGIANLSLFIRIIYTKTIQIQLDITEMEEELGESKPLVHSRIIYTKKIWIQRVINEVVTIYLKGHYLS